LIAKGSFQVLPSSLLSAVLKSGESPSH